jgi:hypothetical protein
MTEGEVCVCVCVVCMGKSESETVKGKVAGHESRHPEPESTTRTA